MFESISYRFYQKEYMISGVTCVDLGPSPWNLEELRVETQHCQYPDRVSVRDRLFRKAMYELALYSIDPMEALVYLSQWNGGNYRPLSFEQLVNRFMKELPKLAACCTVLEPDIELNTKNIVEGE